MRIGAREFRPGLWPSIATMLVLPLLIGLGFWQLDRAEQKRMQRQDYDARRTAPPLDLAALPDPGRQAQVWRRARLRGEYLTGEQYLLDNQVINGEPGYRVYTPFRLQDGQAVVLVNRGWVPMQGGRDAIPEVPPPEADGAVVEGTIKPPRSVGLVLEGAVMEDLGGGLVRVPELDPQAVARRNGWLVLPYVVRLEKDGDSGFVRQWQDPGFGRARHIGYAYQWFAMAAALVIIYVVVNTKRRPNHE